ncbi:hypothetical protein, partial [uncultured Bilophila sp.]|uniref:hypothetical protein n=1 Tax=uncultured Bilophila sp. TaxID=529385 RepID=UPI0026DDC00B
ERKPFWRRVILSPPPGPPSSLFPKTFDFIESLSGGDSGCGRIVVVRRLLGERVLLFFYRVSIVISFSASLVRPGKPSERDSINTKVLGEEGMGFGEGGEKPFFRRVLPPFPNLSPNLSAMFPQRSPAFMRSP